MLKYMEESRMPKADENPKPQLPQNFNLPRGVIPDQQQKKIQSQQPYTGGDNQIEGIENCAQNFQKMMAQQMI